MIDIVLPSNETTTTAPNDAASFLPTVMPIMSIQGVVVIIRITAKI
jgi:hypothetical protein